MGLRKRTTKRVFGLSLTEVALLLVFFLLALLASSSTQYSRLGLTKADLDNLIKFENDVKEAMDNLGTSLDGLRKTASRLIDEGLVEKSKADLAKIIEQLLADRKMLSAKTSDIAEMEEELAKLQKEVMNLKTELEENGNGTGEGGTEPGSCWFTPSGRVEYFLSVVIYDEYFDVDHAWPSHRSPALRAMGIEPAEVPIGKLSNNEFEQFADPIYFITYEEGCRLFVYLTDKTTSKSSYKYQRSFVERYFFVREF